VYKMDNSYLLSELKLEFDELSRPVLYLHCYEYVDYIEDVLCEHFDIETEYSKESSSGTGYTLYFGMGLNVQELEKAIETINAKHNKTNQIYATV